MIKPTKEEIEAAYKALLKYHCDPSREEAKAALEAAAEVRKPERISYEEEAINDVAEVAYASRYRGKSQEELEDFFARNRHLTKTTRRYVKQMIQMYRKTDEYKLVLRNEFDKGVKFATPLNKGKK